MSIASRIETLLHAADKSMAEAKRIAADHDLILCINDIVAAQVRLDDALAHAAVPVRTGKRKKPARQSHFNERTSP